MYHTHIQADKYVTYLDINACRHEYLETDKRIIHSTYRNAEHTGRQTYYIFIHKCMET